MSTPAARAWEAPRNHCSSLRHSRAQPSPAQPSPAQPYRALYLYMYTGLTSRCWQAGNTYVCACVCAQVYFASAGSQGYCMLRRIFTNATGAFLTTVAGACLAFPSRLFYRVALSSASSPDHTKRTSPVISRCLASVQCIVRSTAADPKVSSQAYRFYVCAHIRCAGFDCSNVVTGT